MGNVANYVISRADLIGLSTEEKPVEEIVDGTTFYEVDTTDFYIFYKNNWYNQNVEEE